MRFISYAQNFEDVMLWRAVGKIDRGFYIDVGAADPVDMSVTQAFYTAGWRGVNVEPAMHYFNRLQASRPDDVNLAVAIGEVAGTQVFYEFVDTGLSTLDPNVAIAHGAAGLDAVRREVEVVTLAQVCSQYAPPDIHFLKIDVEGAENRVLSGSDFQKFRPWIVLLEATQPLTTTISAGWEPMMLAANYIFVWFDGLNRFYLAQEHYEEMHRHFQLPPNSFDNFDKYDFRIASRFSGSQLAIAEATQRLDDNANEITLLEEEVLLLRRMHVYPTQLIVENTSLQSALAGARASWEVLNRLVFELRWDEGPRALRLLLPLARGARGLMGNRWFRMAARPVLPLGRRVRALMRSSAAGPAKSGLARQSAAPEQKRLPESIDGEIRSVPASKRPRRTVHQFHPGSAYGDAVTNSMFLIQGILQSLGYRSEIYVEHRDPLLAGRLLLLDDLPLHDEYVLLVHHSLGYDRTEKIAALPAPKIIIYHNITPAHLLAGIPTLAALADIGRLQLDFWRPRASASIAISEFNAAELRRHGYQDVAVCPLLFDIDRLRAGAKPRKIHPPGDPFTILFVGRILESKGQAELVDAFGAFNLLYGQPCRLVFVGRTEGGSDRYLANLYQRIGEQGLRRAVVITGHISDHEVSAWYDRADLYVSLSQHEGFGVPLIEAMARGVPVIAYAGGAVASTMQESGNSFAILYSRDPSVAAAAMLQIANNPQRRDQLIEAQRRNLDRFKLSRHIPTLAQVLVKAGAALAAANNTQHAADHLSFTVTGHFNGSYSLAAVNRSLASALDGYAPHRVRIKPVEGEDTDDLGGVPLREQPQMQRLASMSAPPGTQSVILSQHYPLYVPSFRSESDFLAAYFFWEESLIPEATVARLNDCFDAVFAPSEFVAKTLIDSGVRLPVRTIGYAPPLAKFVSVGQARQAERGPRGDCVFLHVSSAFPRKGIDLLLNAYAASFTAADPIRLIIKTFPNPHNQTASQIAQLRAANANLPYVELIDRDLDETALLKLYADADVAVLPTRGEGFNIPAAEAIAAGLRLIVTGGGGHADFIKEGDAILLPWRVEQSRSHLASSQSLWLAPDQDALASAMREAFDQIISHNGARSENTGLMNEALNLRFDRNAWGRRIGNATAEILSRQPAGGQRIAIISSWDVPCGVAEYTRHLIKAISVSISRDDSLLILSDDRARISVNGVPRLAVRSGWTLCGTDTAERLATAVSQEDSDILIIQHQPGLIEWSSLAALLADRRLHAPVVLVTLHTTQQILDLSAEQQRQVLAGLRGCARVIVHTAADVNLLHRLGLSANVVMVAHAAPAPLGWPRLRALDAASSPVIGSYGFLLPKKGLPELISAIPLIRKVWPGLRVRMVNALYPAEISRQEHEECKELADQLHIGDHIEWITDFHPHEQSNALLSACDLIVLPYQHSTESSSAALRSCLASGTPVAVTPLPLFDEAEDAVLRLSGLTPAAIADGVIQLLADRQARDALQAAAAGWLADRSWEKTGRRVHGMMMGLTVNRDDTQTTLVKAAECV